MASYSDASAKRDAIYLTLLDQFHIRPRAIGIMPLNDDRYAIKVTLPRRTLAELPTEVYGVPVRYEIADEPAVLTGGTKMKWFEKAIGGK